MDVEGYQDTRRREGSLVGEGWVLSTYSGRMYDMVNKVFASLGVL